MEKEIILFNDKKDCCGCWACENICPKDAITMAEDECGLLYPFIDIKKCIKCGMCIKTCPIKKRQSEIDEERKVPHVKILNYGNHLNFGAALTSACLEATIKKIVPDNYIVQTLNYEPADGNVYTDFKVKLSVYTDLVKIVLKKLKIIKNKDAQQDDARNINSPIKFCRYTLFRNAFVNSTAQLDNYDLENDRDNDVALICGSDVVWFPLRLTHRSAMGYYLNFGPKSAKRISIAASVDSAYNGKLRRKRAAYKKRLKKFNAVSVREIEDIPFIQSATSLHVRHCVDPAFYFTADEYEPMMAMSQLEKSNEDYIYFYILTDNDTAYEYVKKLAEEKNMKIVYFSKQYSDFGDNSENCFDDGPAEFLQRISESKYVVTNSFHCVVYSLIFNKQFAAFNRGNASIKIPDILRVFDISDRLVQDVMDFDIDKPIDFDEIDMLIEKYKNVSVDYLKEVLKDI